MSEDAAWEIAINEVRTNHATGKLRRPNGSRCAIGALGFAIYGQLWDDILDAQGYRHCEDRYAYGSWIPTDDPIHAVNLHPMTEKLRHVLEEQEGRGGIMAFNDSRARTAEGRERLAAYMEKARVL